MLIRKFRTAISVAQQAGGRRVVELAARAASEGVQLAAFPVLPDTRRLQHFHRRANAQPEFTPLSVSVDEFRQGDSSLLFQYMALQFGRCIKPSSAVTSGLEKFVLLDAAYQLWQFDSIVRDADWYLDCPDAFSRRHRQIITRSLLRAGQISRAKRLAGRRLQSADAATALLMADVWNAADDDDFAAEAYDRAFGLAPYNPMVLLHRGFHFLKTGRISDGFRQWCIADRLFGAYPALPQSRLWHGEALDGKRIVVLFEHGLGDMIQLSRFLPELQSRYPGALISAKIPLPLTRLFKHSYPTVGCLNRLDRRSIDYYIPSVQLPAALGVSHITPSKGYIPPVRSTVHQRRSSAKIGICWRGHPRAYEMSRSVGVEEMSTLFDLPNCEFLSLVYQPTEQERAYLDGFSNVTLPAFEGFDEMLSIVEQCDVVVTVDTAAAHLAGAAGVKVFLLTRPDSCWRWGVRGAQNPWYQSVTVMRHDEDMDWPLVIARTKELLGRGAGRTAMAS